MIENFDHMMSAPAGLTLSGRNAYPYSEFAPPVLDGCRLWWPAAKGLD